MPPEFWVALAEDGTVLAVLIGEAKGHAYPEAGFDAGFGHAMELGWCGAGPDDSMRRAVPVAQPDRAQDL